MKTIESLKEVTTLEVGDKVVFGDLEYVVTQCMQFKRYYLMSQYGSNNDKIFSNLGLNKKDFIKKLGINADFSWDFPEVMSLEALTAIVSALFKEYEKLNELPKTWEEFCEHNKMGDKRFCLYHGDIVGTCISKNIFRDTTLIESVEEAQAFKALMQLRQLRKCYVGDWESDWTNDDPKYCIEVMGSELVVNCWYRKSHILSFSSCELAEQFLTNFRDLIENAKVLL